MRQFKNLEPVSAGVVRETPLLEAQRGRISSYAEALKVANASGVPNPPFSKYFVRGSIGIAGGLFLPAGNIEYGVMQALHCEECAVAAFRAHYGWEVKGDIIFGFASSREQINTPPTCCGNCRDVLIDGLGTNFEFVSGGPEGEEAAVSSMNSLLFDRPELLLPPYKAGHIHFDADFLRAWVCAILPEGTRLENDAYSPRSVFPERRYFAAISLGAHEFFGALDGMCEYHPIYPLRDAVRAQRRAGIPSSINFVLVLHDEELSPGPPHVMYKDRQHLLELNLQQEILTESELDPPVLLINHRKGVPTNVWRTSVKEWLPFPFTPRNFGKEFLEHLARYYQGIPR